MILSLFSRSAALLGIRPSKYLGEFAWASRPSAATYPGYSFTAIDVGTYRVFVSNGTSWLAAGGVATLRNNKAAIGIPSNGSIANNGVLTGITALPRIYTEGLYLYFPAGAIATSGAGSAAGKYWTVMSSTTAGTIYNNTYTSGIPTAPTTLVPFVTTGPGAYTQTISTDITMISETINGGLMALSGALDNWIPAITPNNANTKTVKAKLGSTTYMSVTGTTTLSERLEGSIQNVGAANLQFYLGSTGGQAYAPSNSTSVASAYSAEDTSTDLTHLITCSIGVATDYIILPSGRLRLLTN